MGSMTQPCWFPLLLGRNSRHLRQGVPLFGPGWQGCPESEVDTWRGTQHSERRSEFSGEGFSL